MKERDNLNFLIINKLEKEEESMTLRAKLFRNKAKIFSLFIFVFFFSFIYQAFFGKAIDITYELRDGETVATVAKNLKEGGIIKSEYAFRFAEKFLEKSDVVMAGVYKFSESDRMLDILKKINRGEYDIAPIRVTLKEGDNSLEFIREFENAFSVNSVSSSSTTITNSTSSLESPSLGFTYLKDYLINNQGYIFPDTYLFLPNSSESVIVKKIEDNFEKRLSNLFASFKNYQNTENKKEESNTKVLTANLKDLDFKDYFYKKVKDEKGDNVYKLDQAKKVTIINELGTTTVSLKDLIVMASFLEGEARGETDMRMVSGILWQRLKIGMYLQIDAATSTYKAKGLTKNPINNPGLVAIEAAINPTKSNNIYYITDNDGVMHYARDYDTHLKNINKYLRKSGFAKASQDKKK